MNKVYNEEELKTKIRELCKVKSTDYLEILFIQVREELSERHIKLTWERNKSGR